MGSWQHGRTTDRAAASFPGPAAEGATRFGSLAHGHAQAPLGGGCSQERLIRGTETSTMRRAAQPSRCARCGAGAGCSVIKYQSLWGGLNHLRVGMSGGKAHERSERQEHSNKNNGFTHGTRRALPSSGRHQRPARGKQTVNTGPFRPGERKSVSYGGQTTWPRRVQGYLAHKKPPPPRPLQ